MTRCALALLECAVNETGYATPEEVGDALLVLIEALAWPAAFVISVWLITKAWS